MTEKTAWEQAYARSVEPRVHKPTRRRIVTKPQIMAVSATLFHERGYDRTSLDDIAKAVSITKPSLYYHFASKEDILLECIGTGYFHLAAELARHDDATLSGRQRLTVFLRIYLEVISNNVGLGLVLSDDRVMSDAARDKYDGYRRFLNNSVRQHIERGVSDGSIRTLDPRITSYAIFGMFNWVVHWNTGKKNLAVADVLEKFLGIIFDGIGG